LNRLSGVFSRPTHKLSGQSYVNKVLVLDTAKGGVATAWMLYEMRARNMAPAAIVLNSINSILVQGAALGDVAILASFEVDITSKISHGSFVEVDPQARTIRLLAPHELVISNEPTDGSRPIYGP
ncbi:MAG: DUF126 domain-containing protein, partial [Betaproteobacteria bacterium]|nr:DUF126 domain-containing protein [Betaproteobacteria bacterium]